MIHPTFHLPHQCRLLILLVLFGDLNTKWPPNVCALQSEINNSRSSHVHNHYRRGVMIYPVRSTTSSTGRLFSLCLRAGGDNNDVRINVNDQKMKLQLVSKAVQYANKNFFLIGMFVAVILAKIVPTLGENGGILRPELFIGKYGVALIFLLSGLSLQTKDLTQAISNLKLNGLVQLLIFGFWPFCIGLPLHYTFTRILPNLIPMALADGILIMTTLPTTINMCIMLTATSGGNTASAICNAVISNLAGILLTPLLLFKFFGATINLPFGKMVFNLCQKVLFPVTIGKLLRTSDKVTDFYGEHSKTFKRLQEIVLLGIVWNAFCNAFTDGLGIQFKHSLVLLVLLPTLHLTALAASFKLFALPLFRFTKAETIAAMFCSSQKTLAFGLPLVNTIFQGNPNLASFCAPIMFIHPLQMAIGSFLLPTIQQYINGNGNGNSNWDGDDVAKTTK